MKEIKFRGKCLRTNDWVYGSLIIKRNEYYIGYISDISGIWSVIQVEPKTAGQYTGLKDKNGKEIFEGDIIQFKSIRDIIERYEVEYTNYGEWAIGMHRLSMRFKSCEVIGNIYEHSHLLEESQNGTK